MTAGSSLSGPQGTWQDDERPMLSRKRIVWGLGVLGLGLCAALPFEKPSNPIHDGPLKTASGELVLQPRDIALEVSLPSDASPAVGLSSVERGGETGDRPPVRRQPVLREGSPAPQMAAAYPAETEETGGPLRGPANPAGGVAHGGGSPAARLHRVTDGDTLPDLAQKYLGRPDRYLELYEANRRTLAGPDLLPIGAELVIPSPAASATMERMTAEGPARSNRADDPQTSSNLMPIPPSTPIPTNVLRAPRARQN